MAWPSKVQSCLEVNSNAWRDRWQDLISQCSQGLAYEYINTIVILNIIIATTVRHKILKGKNIDEFDEFKAILSIFSLSKFSIYIVSYLLLIKLRRSSSTWNKIKYISEVLPKVALFTCTAQGSLQFPIFHSHAVENFAYWCIPSIFINVITSNNWINI